MTITADQKKALSDALETIDGSLTRAEAEKDLVKTTIDTFCEEHGLDKKVVRKLAKSYHKGDMEAESALQQEVEALYTEVTDKKVGT